MTDTDNQKFFLDLSGLRTLWGKITNTFATKTDVETDITKVSNDISAVEGDLTTFKTTVGNSFDGVNETIATFAPREFEDYTSAVKGSVHMAPASVIKIKTDSEYIDDNGNPIPNPDGTTSIYRAGLYVVVESGKIERVSTASGSGAGENIEDIASLVNDLNKSVIKNVFVQDEDGKPVNGFAEKDGNNLIIKLDDEFVVDSTSVNALTHKAIAAMFGTLSNQISNVPKFKVAVVDDLPEIGTDAISLTTVYLVKNQNTSSNNLYTEYIYVEKTVDGEKTYAWEKLGEQSLNVNDFATKTEVEGMIASAMNDVAKKSDIETAIGQATTDILRSVSETYLSKTEAADFVNNDELSEILGGYYTKTDADTKFLTSAQADTLYVKPEAIEDFVTEAYVLASIQTGNIGDAIAITDDQLKEIIGEN
jgi:hypothetical protein